MPAGHTAFISLQRASRLCLSAVLETGLGAVQFQSSLVRASFAPAPRSLFDPLGVAVKASFGVVSPTAFIEKQANTDDEIITRRGGADPVLNPSSGKDSGCCALLKQPNTPRLQAVAINQMDCFSSQPWLRAEVAARQFGLIAPMDDEIPRSAQPSDRDAVAHALLVISAVARLICLCASVNRQSYHRRLNRYHTRI